MIIQYFCRQKQPEILLPSVLIDSSTHLTHFFSPQQTHLEILRASVVVENPFSYILLCTEMYILPLLLMKNLSPENPSFKTRSRASCTNPMYNYLHQCTGFSESEVTFGGKRARRKEFAGTIFGQLNECTLFFIGRFRLLPKSVKYDGLSRQMFRKNAHRCTVDYYRKA